MFVLEYGELGKTKGKWLIYRNDLDGQREITSIPSSLEESYKSMDEN
jgi:hypothetical protein